MGWGTGAVPVGEHVSARDDLRRFTHPCAVQAELLNLRRPLVLGVVRCQAEGATGREQRRLWCVGSATDGLGPTQRCAHTRTREQSRAPTALHHCAALLRFASAAHSGTGGRATVIRRRVLSALG